MRLLTLRMENFRQFYGKSPTIHFAYGDRNITVFHGTNGAGKTALLNAFTWTLFNSTTNGFQFPEQIVNLRAIREAKDGDTVSAVVEIVFEHQDRKYVVKRVAEVIKTNEAPGWIDKGASEPTLQWSGPDGKWNTETRVYDVVGRILPPDLHSYFFFDGERIERLVQPTKKERMEIANATKKLLGVEILDRAVNHLNFAKREIEKELKDIGDAETKRLISEKQECEGAKEQKNDRLREIDRNIDAENERREEIERRLRELEDTRAIQERRDQLTKELQARRDTYDELRKQLATLVSQSGYTVFLDGAINTFQEIIRELHERGELPSGIKRNFVEALLKDASCICGRSLEEGTESWKAVENWMLKAGLVDVEEKAIRMDGEVTQIAKTMPQFLEQMDSIQQHIAADRKEINRIEEELDEIRLQLEKSPREEVSRLEQQRERTYEVIRVLQEEYGAIQAKIGELDNRISELESLINRHRANEARQGLLQRQISATQDSIERIQRIRELLEEDFREGLLRKITMLFNEISPTPYIPDLGQDYSLRLLNTAGGAPVPVAASEGESQILSLAFIGSIIDLAREYQAKQDHLPGPQSSSYPLVMDSPFGKLGPTYRHQIAEHIPALADQVVAMVTETQWRGEVEQSMKKRVGKIYVLTYYSPRSGIATESIDLGGQTYEFIKTSPNEFEYTEIMEVEHG